MDKVEPTFGVGAVPSRYWLIHPHRGGAVEGGVIEESSLAIYVNGQELATLLCSPLDQEALAFGFLRNAGVIAALDEVQLARLNAARTVMDIFLGSTTITLPRRVIMTSGCSGGIIFDSPHPSQPSLESTFVTEPQTLIARMGDLHQAADLYAEVRGVHTSILATPDRVLFSAEDIGRHNTIDKLAGKALQQCIDTRDCLLLTTGRISSEMVVKAWRMGVPLIASRTSPTSAALELARTWAICVVGYLRGASMRVYTHPERLSLPGLD